jgi:hypothetical protein
MAVKLVCGDQAMIRLVTLILSVASALGASAGAQNAHVFGNPNVWQWPPSRGLLIAADRFKS